MIKKCKTAESKSQDSKFLFNIIKNTKINYRKYIICRRRKSGSQINPIQLRYRSLVNSPIESHFQCWFQANLKGIKNL